MIEEKAENLAEELFSQAIENFRMRGGNGLSPTLVNDWKDAIVKVVEECLEWNVQNNLDLMAALAEGYRKRQEGK